MLYSVWCIRNENYEIEADSVDEAIIKAKEICSFRPDEIEIELAEVDEEEE